MRQDQNAPLRLALEAVLLFHEPGPWDNARRESWALLTGGKEATTKALCDVVRAALSLEETADGETAAAEAAADIVEAALRAITGSARAAIERER